jgi:hypothetical protein
LQYLRKVQKDGFGEIVIAIPSKGSEGKVWRPKQASFHSPLLKEIATASNRG